MLEDRGVVPKENGDVMGEYKVMHEEKILSGWLKEDVEGKAEERESVCRKQKKKPKKKKKKTSAEKRV